MKGLKDLAEAWRSLLGTERKDWEIVFIGDGPLKPILLKLEQAKTLSFMQPKELVRNRTSWLFNSSKSD